MARAPRSNSNATAAKLATHEEVCALRYAGIMSRIGRLEALVIGATGTTIIGLIWAVWQLSRLAR